MEWIACIPPDLVLGPRSPEWENVRHEFVRKHPMCAVCGSLEVEVHHIYPFHLFPEYELDPTWMISLCRPHHFVCGHGMNWSAWIPSCRKVARMFSELRRTR